LTLACTCSDTSIPHLPRLPVFQALKLTRFALIKILVGVSFPSDLFSLEVVISLTLKLKFIA